MENSKLQCLSKRNKSKRDACIQNSDVQEVDMYVLEEKGFTALWIATQKQQGLNEKQIDAKAAALGIAGFSASYGSAIHDVRSFYLLAEDLKRGGAILSKYEINQHANKSYIKFKGNHKLRSLIKGTRYLSDNAKIIALGIGKEGIKASAKAGVVVTVVYSVVFRTLELALTKNYSVANWIVNLSADVVIASIAATLGYVGGKMLVGVGIVLIPLAAGVFISIAVGIGLGMLDGRYQIREKILESLNKHIMLLAYEDINQVKQKANAQKAMHQLSHSSFGGYFR